MNYVFDIYELEITGKKKEEAKGQKINIDKDKKKQKSFCL